MGGTATTLDGSGASIGSAVMASPTAIFSGVGVALVTLFDGEGEIDAPATGDHAARLVDAGVQAVVVAGTTGEAATLDDDERSDLLIAVRYAVDGRVPVLVGSGAPSARQAVLLSKRAEHDGADALLVLSPAGAPDPRPYYERVTAAVEVPVLAYHNPKASAPGVPVDVLGQLPVAGIKDSSGDAERLLIEADELPSGVYTGHPTLIHLAGAIGCSGAILALANVDPEGCLRAWAGDGTIQRELINGHRAQSLTGIPGLKRTLCALHGTSPVTRV
jgi:4-hydroxy-tetrahydrodipicolinate synthase